MKHEEHEESKFRFALINILVAVIGGIAVILAALIGGTGRLAVVSPTLTPLPTNTPAPTPIASLASFVLKSEVQPDGTIKNISTLTVNSLGVGELLLTYPREMNLRDSALVRLSITPSSALVSLSSVSVPTQNTALPPPFRFTDRIDIYPVMQAELSGAGFEITSDEQPLKAIVSDRPTEWTWTLKPKAEGSHQLVVRVSIPVRVDGIEKYLLTTLKNIPAEIKVTKSLQNRIDEMLPIIIPALVGLIGGIIGFYANSRIKEREQKIAQLENEIKITEGEKTRKLLSPDRPLEQRRLSGITEDEKIEMLKNEINRLKAIPRWQFWHR